MKIDLRYIRPTKKEFGHTKVSIGGAYQGYFMPNRSKFSNFGENWNFCGNSGTRPSFYTSSRNAMLVQLTRL